MIRERSVGFEQMQNIYLLKEQSRSLGSNLTSADVRVDNALAWPRFCNVTG